MIQFFKDASREIKHVVWPTSKETKKYFFIVLIVFVLFGTYLFLAGSLFSSVIFYLKDLIN